MWAERKGTVYFLSGARSFRSTKVSHAGPYGIIAVMGTLDGYLVIDLSLNLPGPLATARLAEMGPRVVKVEPPGGDPAGRFSALLYSELNDCKEVFRLNLKTEPGQSKMRNLLADADLLLTAFRPTALERLKLGWSLLNPEFPRLCHVEIIGFPGRGWSRVDMT